MTDDGHIDQNDVLLHFGHSNFTPGASLSGELNYVQFADGQNGLILVDTAHLPEDFDLLSALATLNINSIPANPTGDYNANGVVDAADYVVWRKSDGVPAGYQTWRANFGETLGSGTGASMNATVPEPGTLVMFIVATGWCLLRRPAA